MSPGSNSKTPAVLSVSSIDRTPPSASASMTGVYSRAWPARRTATTGFACRIRLGAGRAGEGTVRLEVQDSGPGIPDLQRALTRLHLDRHLLHDDPGDRVPA